MDKAKTLRSLSALMLLALMLPAIPSADAYAHRDGCHARHSCPSNANPPTYVCGDLGYPCEVQANTVPPGSQGGSRLFPETGKTVKGKFLVYWDTHGGLAQQ